MLFAHGPLGALLADRSLRMWWKNKITPKQKWLVLLAGFVGGIFPDIDLFYYYLVDASKPHREFITHSFFIYVAAFIVFYFIGAVFVKKSVFKMVVIVFFAGVVSHLVVDSVLAEVPWLLPFSSGLYGLSDFSVLRPWLFSFNFILEFLLAGLFIWLLISFTSWSIVRKRVLTAGVGAAVLVACLGTVWVDSHNLDFDFNTPFLDMDDDGVNNRADVDIDGDGIVNSRDLDADGNDISNFDQLAQFGDFTGVWYDVTEGGFIEIPQRFGLPTTASFMQYVFSGLGISLEVEMKEDYALLSEGYAYPPTSAHFDNSVANIQAWLSHSGRLLPAERVTRFAVGDILFFGGGLGPHDIENVGVVKSFTADGHIILSEADRVRGVGDHLLDDVIRDQGEPIFVGRILTPITNEDL